VYVHHDGSEDRLAVVEATGGTWPQILAQGHDFYMQPCWSPDGRRLAYVAWDHPNMPWDGTLLYLAEVEYTTCGPPRLAHAWVVAGGPEIAIFQPEFTPDGNRLLFVSDETGWGRLACLDLVSSERRWLTPGGVEYAVPAWLQGQRTIAPLADGRRLVAAASERGFVCLELIDIESGTRQPIAPLAAYTDVNYPVAHPRRAKVAALAGSPRIPTRLLLHDLDTQATQVLARTNGETLPPDALATAQAISWPSAGETAHGLYYAPHSTQFESPGRPPLVVIVHGGPTSQVRAGWRPEAQFLATRGYAVLFVNYRGSTGYGRAYMLRLRGNWGVCDVEDCLSGVEHLASLGAIDRGRTVIMGGSAGGFTVLQTLTQHPKAFTAGISLYGVANQFALAADTHKFESRYTDSLIGPLPEAAARYRERSPVFHAARIQRPLAVFQGDIDRVVPRDQSDAIVEALRRNGTPHEYHVYQGEGHGWRKRETIEHYYRSVEGFLKRYVIYS
jgi:dipeptidyl aminopeptidase/acylaminoacyl peptidase